MAITNGLITLAEAKQSLGITVTTNDSDIEDYIEAATPVIEQIAGPQYSRNLSFTFDGGSTAVVIPHRFTSVVSLLVDGVALADYIARPASGVIYAGTTEGLEEFESGVQNVVVTVAVGSATIPANVKLAARELVRHWWQQGRQGNRPAFGNEAEAQDAPMGFSVPRRVYQLLEPSPRVPGFA